MTETTIYNDLWLGLQILLSLVGSFALMAQGFKPPADKGFYGSAFYKVIYRIVNVIGANNVWAKNFADPKQRIMWQTILKGVASTVATLLAAAAAQSTKVETPTVEENSPVVPVVSAFKRNGEPVIEHDVH